MSYRTEFRLIFGTHQIVSRVPSQRAATEHRNHPPPSSDSGSRPTPFCWRNRTGLMSRGRTGASAASTNRSRRHRRCASKEDSIAMRIEIGEPLSCGALIMRAAPAPFLLDREDVAILPDELMARHHATGEEVLRDPVLAISPVERIRSRHAFGSPDDRVHDAGRCLSGWQGKEHAGSRLIGPVARDGRQAPKIRRHAKIRAKPMDCRSFAKYVGTKARFQLRVPGPSPKSAHPALFLGERCAIVRRQASNG